MMTEHHDVVFRDGLPEVKSVFLGNKGGTTIQEFIETIKIANRLGCAGRRITKVEVNSGETYTANLHHVAIYQDQSDVIAQPPDDAQCPEPSPQSD